METHLKIVGGISILLALLHIGFPRYFQWKEELAKLSLINKQVMEVHTFFILIIVLLMGILSISITPKELASPLGKKVMLGFFLFWLIRLVIQFAWYSPKLWKGKPFETSVHITFSMIWLYFTAVYCMAWK